MTMLQKLRYFFETSGDVRTLFGFARFLVASGRVRTLDEAFHRYLGTGKPAACRMEWPGMAEAAGEIGLAADFDTLLADESNHRDELRQMLARSP